MSTRREFIRTGAAVAALTALDPARSDERGDSSLALYKVILDSAFPSSAAFGRRASELGLATHASPSDVTSLWYHDLHPRWVQSAVAIAGLTSPESLFCLERLAWDHSMRVLFRAFHRPVDSSSIEHVLTGPQSVVRALTSAYATRDAWTDATAEAFAGFPTAQGALIQRTLRVRGSGRGARLGTTLVSWVIGPISKTTAA